MDIPLCTRISLLKYWIRKWEERRLFEREAVILIRVVKSVLKTATTMMAITMTKAVTTATTTNNTCTMKLNGAVYLTCFHFSFPTSGETGQNRSLANRSIHYHVDSNLRDSFPSCGQDRQHSRLSWPVSGLPHEHKLRDKSLDLWLQTQSVSWPGQKDVLHEDSCDRPWRQTSK